VRIVGPILLRCSRSAIEGVDAVEGVDGVDGVDGTEVSFEAATNVER
jgi:hypothetical protein